MHKKIKEKSLGFILALGMILMLPLFVVLLHFM